MMIALNQDPWARHLFLIPVFYFDDSPSAKCQDHLLFLVNRFRFRVIKLQNWIFSGFWKIVFGLDVAQSMRL